MLSVNDYSVRRELFVISPNFSSPRIDAGFPKEKVSDWITAIHRIEKVANLNVLPNERALNVWQADLTAADCIDQRTKRVINLSK